jgi:undecaprenyl diphosphate synthase
MQNSISNAPRHIAIIMDGNGRWAQQRGLPRTAGHREGVKRVREIVKAASEYGIKFLTFFAFSTENWRRPKKEIDMLMRSLVNFLDRRIGELHKNNIRFKVIGRQEPLPGYVLAKIKRAMQKTEYNTGLTVILALNYGSRQEIIDASRKFAELVSKGKLNLQDLDEALFNSFLYTAGFPDPDLLIRTSGEARLSNFLLWQLSYSELYFPKIYWPDFRAEYLEIAIKAYAKRDRRFGDINAS